MAFQMPAWKAPGVSLNYRPMQTPAAPQLDPKMLAALAAMPKQPVAAAPTAAAPVNPATAGLPRIRFDQYGNRIDEFRGGFGGSSQSGSHAGFSGTLGAGGFGGRYGGGPGNRGGGLY
jgi:hypothetical protein